MSESILTTISTKGIALGEEFWQAAEAGPEVPEVIEEFSELVYRYGAEGYDELGAFAASLIEPMIQFVTPFFQEFKTIIAPLLPEESKAPPAPDLLLRGAEVLVFPDPLEPELEAPLPAQARVAEKVESPPPGSREAAPANPAKDPAKIVEKTKAVLQAVPESAKTLPQSSQVTAPALPTETPLLAKRASPQEPLLLLPVASEAAPVIAVIAPSQTTAAQGVDRPASPRKTGVASQELSRDVSQGSPKPVPVAVWERLDRHDNPKKPDLLVSEDRSLSSSAPFPSTQTPPLKTDEPRRGGLERPSESLALSDGRSVSAESRPSRISVSQTERVEEEGGSFLDIHPEGRSPESGKESAIVRVAVSQAYNGLLLAMSALHGSQEAMRAVRASHSADILSAQAFHHALVSAVLPVSTTAFEGGDSDKHDRQRENYEDPTVIIQ